MQPAKTSEELAEMYPDLESWQRDELEAAVVNLDYKFFIFD